MTYPTQAMVQTETMHFTTHPLRGRQILQEKAHDHLTPEQRQQVKDEGAVIQPEAVEIPRAIRIDLHCHSVASHDSVTALDAIPERCAERNIQVLALTDHDAIWGAQALQQIVPHSKNPSLTVIVGEEISTSAGELIGLFLKEKVAPGRSPRETIQAIKSQGGLVLLPHGFDPLRVALDAEIREEISQSIDIVETFNARVARRHWNRLADEWSEKHGMLKSAGSDAHLLSEIGSAWVEVPARPVQTPEDLRLALQDGVPMGTWRHPLFSYFYSYLERFYLKLKTVFS
ncbi:MAG: PHP-associated domain-containing protein [Chloroflexota bacterium]